MLLVEGLRKRYGEKTVLQGASFRVKEKEFVSIVGPSGEGKSTIARILCGTIQPDCGTISFCGQRFTQNSTPKALRRAIQLIPQQPYASLDPRQTIGGAISEPLRFHKIAKSRAQAKEMACALLERVLLSPRLYGRRPGELSGGQAQRVLIARSLTLSPALLIADEATSMLDVSSQAQIVRLFRQLMEEEGLSVLLISHDRPLVEAVSDRVYHLSGGKMTEIESKTLEEKPE